MECLNQRALASRTGAAKMAPSFEGLQCLSTRLLLRSCRWLRPRSFHLSNYQTEDNAPVDSFFHALQQVLLVDQLASSWPGPATVGRT